jgi:hypothetical protein
MPLFDRGDPFGREDQGHGRPGAFGAVRHNGAPVKGHEQLADVKPEAGAAELSADLGIGLLERMEQARPLGIRDTDTGVGHSNFEAACGDVMTDADLAVSFGKLDGVRENIDEDLLERTRIGNETGDIQSVIDDDADALFSSPSSGTAGFPPGLRWLHR